MYVVYVTDMSESQFYLAVYPSDTIWLRDSEYPCQLWTGATYTYTASTNLKMGV